jgi:hypothetical protein
MDRLSMEAQMSNICINEKAPITRSNIFQWSVGVSYPILSQLNAPLPHIEPKWIASIRLFLATAHLTIHVNTQDIPPLQPREGDAEANRIHIEQMHVGCSHCCYF